MTERRPSVSRGLAAAAAWLPSLLLALLLVTLGFGQVPSAAAAPPPRAQAASAPRVGRVARAPATTALPAPTRGPAAPGKDEGAAAQHGNWSTAVAAASPVNESGAAGSHGPERFAVLQFDFQKVSAPFLISFWILVASIAKIGFHFSHKLSSVLPESSLLIVLGIIVGVMFFYSTDNRAYHMMDAHTFFYFLLPPIILESGYFMPNRAFFDNIGTILLYAVVGTLFNTFAIGMSLWGLSMAGALGEGGSIHLLHCLLFSSLVSAVDPVAVLAVFQEIHVNQMLHIIVFGESLLNDAVTVVLYHMFEAYSHMGAENIQPIDVVSGVAAFFVVGLGGTIMGILFGLLGAFVTKYTSHVRVIEPIFIFLIAYLSYLGAETFHFSGIMALTFCGMTMKRYAEPNISEKSQTTVKYFMKMLSSVSETIIFLFLGTSTVMDSHAGNAVFIIMTVMFCLLYRAIGVVFLTAIVNRYRLLKLSYVDQFVMSYSGLRGAVAFALAITLDADVIESKNLFVTTTMVVILFTVFIQGTTVKPLVNALHVKKQNKEELTMNKQINERLIHHLMAGIEEINGIRGNHWLRHRFEYYDSKYLKRYLLRERPRTRETAILRVSSKLSLRDAMEQAQKPVVLNRVSSSAGSMNNLALEPRQFRLYRNMSEAEMRRCPTFDMADSIAKLSTSGTVIDIQALEATSSKKMADDSKIHHILTDTVVHSRKKWSKKRKRPSDVDESDMHVPTHRHHHTFRLHLRPVISQQQQRKQQRSRRSGTTVAPNLGAVNLDASHDHTDDGAKCPKNVTFCDMPAAVKSSTSTPRLDDLLPKQCLNILDPVHNSDIDDNEDDMGITFRVSSSDNHQADEATHPAMPYLPWRSDAIGSGHCANGTAVLGGSSGGILPWHSGGAGSPPADERGGALEDAPAIITSPGSVAELLPWRQVDDSVPELSHRAQSDVPVLALVVDNLSDGGSSATSPTVERASSRGAVGLPRFELYASSDDDHEDSVSSGWPPAAAAPTRLPFVDSGGGSLPPAFLRDAPDVAAAIGGGLPLSFRAAGAVGRRPSADWKALTTAQDTVYEDNESLRSGGGDTSDESTAAADSKEASDDDELEEEDAGGCGDVKPLAFGKLQRAKNSIERLNERLSRIRKRECDSGDDESDALLHNGRGTNEPGA